MRKRSGIVTTDYDSIAGLHLESSQFLTQCWTSSTIWRYETLTPFQMMAIFSPRSH